MDSMKIDQIAMACHQANKGLCEAFGDQSQKDWPDAPEWARESARKGVEFCLANPDAPASANFDEGIGRKIARENARKKIWQFEGYRLCQHLYDARGF